jgi:hypothetical protein
MKTSCRQGNHKAESRFLEISILEKEERISDVIRSILGNTRTMLVGGEDS